MFESTHAELNIDEIIRLQIGDPIIYIGIPATVMAINTDGRQVKYLIKTASGNTYLVPNAFVNEHGGMFTVLNGPEYEKLW